MNGLNSWLLGIVSLGLFSCEYAVQKADEEKVFREQPRSVLCAKEKSESDHARLFIDATVVSDVESYLRINSELLKKKQLRTFLKKEKDRFELRLHKLPDFSLETARDLVQQKIEASQTLLDCYSESFSIRRKELHLTQETQLLSLDGLFQLPELQPQFVQLFGSQRGLAYFQELIKLKNLKLEQEWLKDLLTDSETKPFTESSDENADSNPQAPGDEALVPASDPIPDTTLQSE